MPFSQDWHMNSNLMQGGHCQPCMCRRVQAFDVTSEENPSFVGAPLAPVP